MEKEECGADQGSDGKGDGGREKNQGPWTKNLAQGVFSFQIFIKIFCRLIFSIDGGVSRETC